MAQAAVWDVSQGAPSASTTSTPWTREEFVGAFSDLHANACWSAERAWEARSGFGAPMTRDLVGRTRVGGPHLRHDDAEGSDDRKARTAVGEVIDIADERFSTMIANANSIRSAWARKFEQLD